MGSWTARAQPTARRFLHRITFRENATMDARARPLSSAERHERLQGVLRELERRFGFWIVYRLGARRALAGPVSRPVIPTGSFALDLVMGIGGYLRGRLTELVGP